MRLNEAGRQLASEDLRAGRQSVADVAMTRLSLAEVCEIGETYDVPKASHEIGGQTEREADACKGSEDAA